MEELSSLPSPRATDFQELSHSALAKVRAPAASHSPRLMATIGIQNSSQLFPFRFNRFSRSGARPPTYCPPRTFMCSATTLAFRPMPASRPFRPTRSALAGRPYRLPFAFSCRGLGLHPSTSSLTTHITRKPTLFRITVKEFLRVLEHDYMQESQRTARARAQSVYTLVRQTTIFRAAAMPLCSDRYIISHNNGLHLLRNGAGSERRTMLPTVILRTACFTGTPRPR